MPRIYKKYITEQQDAVEQQVNKAYNHSKLFILSHDVHTIKAESKGVLGSVFGMFAKKAEEAGI